MTEEVMNDLHDATLQYINCDDPVESAARRQRVLHGDALGEMEETAARIIASPLMLATRFNSNYSTPQRR